MLSDSAFTKIAQARNLVLTTELVHNFQDWSASVGAVDDAISAVALEDVLIVVATGYSAERLQKLVEASELAEVERP